MVRHCLDADAMVRHCLDDDAMVRHCLDDDAMVRQCIDDDAMVRQCNDVVGGSDSEMPRLYDSAMAMVRHCDGDDAMTMVQWFDDEKAIVYRAIVIAKSGYGLFCTYAVCKKRAIKLLCSLQICCYDLPITHH